MLGMGSLLDGQVETSSKLKYSEFKLSYISLTHWQFDIEWIRNVRVLLIFLRARHIEEVEVIILGEVVLWN